MKRKILVSMGAVIAVLLILPAVLPESVRISRSVEIQAPKDRAYSYLLDLNEFSKWSPFQEMDPGQQVRISGSGIGSSLTWKSERMGEGIMTLESAQPGNVIQTRMVFLSPLKGEGISLWKLATQENAATEVTWQFEQKLSYFQRYFGPMMDSGLGRHFEKGLANLKAKLEGVGPAAQ